MIANVTLVDQLKNEKEKSAKLEGELEDIGKKLLKDRNENETNLMNLNEL